MYELIVHDQVTEYEDRWEAVVAAKELTGRPDGPVTSTVTNGIETLNFKDGKLIAYTYETRRNEQRRSREVRDDDAATAAPAPTAEPAADDAPPADVQ